MFTSLLSFLVLVYNSLFLPPSKIVLGTVCNTESNLKPQSKSLCVCVHMLKLLNSFSVCVQRAGLFILGVNNSGQTEAHAIT